MYEYNRSDSFSINVLILQQKTIFQDQKVTLTTAATTSGLEWCHGNAVKSDIYGFPLIFMNCGAWKEAYVYEIVKFHLMVAFDRFITLLGRKWEQVKDKKSTAALPLLQQSIGL